ncbi:TetR/AcrR family transcriptional regulator [Mycobacterium montefiorense]|uniref:TetR/AcrR family transcriptional regulator n=1 Tax=Mycobacterium montefiorense TaxID=154654 RepID=UPI0021F37A61|nr:TetR/AcrR family transcriptional regulator [Mycobacterium montefiorense]MCV7425600.1 TetR/AcrR family transcriptional regulator [Mycobacterium montefiorense]
MAPGERREQLLDAGLRIIVEHGVHKVSIDAVAREAGVSRPVVYGLFEDSGQLLRALLDREEAGALLQMTDAFPRIGSDDTAAAVVDSLTKFLDAVQSTPERWRAVFMLVDSSTPAFRHRVEAGRRAYIAALAAFVRSAVPDDRLESVDIEMTARTLFALTWDAGRLVLDDPANYPPARIAKFADATFRAMPALRGPDHAHPPGSACRSDIVEQDSFKCPDLRGAFSGGRQRDLRTPP